MKKFLPFAILLLSMLIFYGCDKEKIVTTTETVSETEYITLPPDTVIVRDTVNQTNTVYDTVIIVDTVNQSSTTTDTVVITQNNYDTVTVVNTVTVTDTVTTTVTVTDTVTQIDLSPNPYYAYSALQYQTNPGVLQFINTEFGLSDGWIFYLTSFQNDIVDQTNGVYDFYGFIDYWTPDWSSYYPLEYYWRVTYTGGDPSNPENWALTDPPAAVSGNQGGIKLKTDRSQSQLK